MKNDLIDNITDYIKKEIDKPLDDYNLNTRLWSKGYKRALFDILRKIEDNKRRNLK
ncbi:hypothetical protein [Abyssisolibacter fermentans]|uniref:hypothetical protein n=1 Tax=Abyssisolibacter fermentans TaxID=1766203 RepID=UPI0012E3A419|nr:hypothetical protein [Abyssisolibacter fermentans]